LARITVEDCLKRVPNRFAIVNLAAQRVREIREGSEYLVSSPKNEDIVVALREIAAGKVVPKKRGELITGAAAAAALEKKSEETAAAAAPAEDDPATEETVTEAAAAAPPADAATEESE